MDRIKNGVRGLPDLSILISCYLTSGRHVGGYRLGEQLTFDAPPLEQIYM